jgi:hypothetical protein
MLSWIHQITSRPEEQETLGAVIGCEKWEELWMLLPWCLEAQIFHMTCLDLTEYKWLSWESKSHDPESTSVCETHCSQTWFQSSDLVLLLHSGWGQLSNGRWEWDIVTALFVAWFRPSLEACSELLSTCLSFLSPISFHLYCPSPRQAKEWTNKTSGSMKRQCIKIIATKQLQNYLPPCVIINVNINKSSYLKMSSS